jgi:ORF6N domain
MPGEGFHASAKAVRIQWHTVSRWMSSRKKQLPLQRLESLILVIRNQRVILDADLAKLYGVMTKRFNEAFKRNHRRFPEDFAFQLTVAEFKNLRSQNATSSHGGRRYRPWAFPKHGAVMAANILRSERAVHMSVFVVRAFVHLREHVAANQGIKTGGHRPDPAPTRFGLVGPLREIPAFVAASSGPAQATNRFPVEE